LKEKRLRRRKHKIRSPMPHSSRGRI